MSNYLSAENEEDYTLDDNDDDDAGYDADDDDDVDDFVDAAAVVKEKRKRPAAAAAGDNNTPSTSSSSSNPGDAAAVAAAADCGTPLEHIHLYRLLLKNRHNSTKTKNILSILDREETNAISEVISNAIYNNLKCIKNINDFAPHKKLLRKLANPTLSHRSRKKLMVTRKGAGVVTGILSVAVPLLLSYFTSR